MEFYPLTNERWSDFERLFGERGAYGGCWCMWWRLTRSEFSRQQGEGNRKAMQEIVASGEVPGILAYLDGEPVAWCSVAPRESYASLNRSPVLKRLDDVPVWSIVCFYVAKEYRGKGVTGQLIRAAIEYARQQGGKVVEAYPTRPKGGRLPPVSSFMGTPSVFEKAGFVECARPSESKVIMRYCIKRGVAMNDIELVTEPQQIVADELATKEYSLIIDGVIEMMNDTGEKAFFDGLFDAIIEYVEVHQALAGLTISYKEYEYIEENETEKSHGEEAA